MVLTSEFWANYSKRDSDKEFEDKIVKNDIIITIQKSKKRFQRLSHCHFKGSDFDAFFSDLVELIKKKNRGIQN